MKTDTHTHSAFSDGELSPEDLALAVKNAGLGGFALTDHDGFAGNEKAKIASNQLGIYFLPGCEFSTRLREFGEVHVLGYFPHGGQEGVQDILDRALHLRRKRAEEMAEKLTANGLNFDFDELLRQNDATDDETRPIGRMHFARELLRIGAVKNIEEAFDRFLKAGRKAYVPYIKPDTVTVIRRITDAGGYAALAHPRFLDKRRSREVFPKFVSAGLWGIEAYHPKVPMRLSEKIVSELSGAFFMTSGSDFHGFLTSKELGNYGVETDALIAEFEE